MTPNLKVGRQALYCGVPVSVLELTGHDDAVVSLNHDAGVITVKRDELIVLANPNELFKKSDVTAIPEAVWNKAKLRAEAVRDLLAMETGVSKALKKKSIELKMTERQLWRLYRQYQAHQSVTGMMPATVGRKVGAKVLDLEVERVIAKLVGEFFLQPERPTLKQFWERICAACRDQKLAEPSQKTIARRLEAYEDRESQSKRVGSKAAKYKYQPMPGHVEVSAPLERVEIDHTPMDVMVRSDDPRCAYVGRPWLTLAVDVYTRCILGINIGFESPSALNDALCMTHAALEKNPAAEFGVPLEWPMHGKPKEIWVDNGKDFCSEAFVRGCEEHNIKLCYRPVGSPHYGGTIERLIGTMVGHCHLLPGTTKRSVQQKSDYNSTEKAALTLREVRQWFVEQVLGSYHVKPHRTLRVPPLIAWQRAMKGDSDV